MYRSTLSLTSAQDGGGGQRQAPTSLRPGNRPGVHCTGGWVGPRVGLDVGGKSRPQWDSILGPSSPLRFAIRTKTLTRKHEYLALYAYSFLTNLNKTYII